MGRDLLLAAQVGTGSHPKGSSLGPCRGSRGGGGVYLRAFRGHGWGEPLDTTDPVVSTLTGHQNRLGEGDFKTAKAPDLGFFLIILFYFIYFYILIQ